MTHAMQVALITGEMTGAMLFVLGLIWVVLG
jgi:flagellar biogenesis protein FliO